MPCLQQLRLVLLDKMPAPIDRLAAQPLAARQANRIKPELGFPVVALDVDVGQLGTIAGIEEEPLRPDPQHRRHAPMLRQRPSRGNAVATKGSIHPTLQCKCAAARRELAQSGARATPFCLHSWALPPGQGGY